MAPLLELSGITKSFGGVRALDDVSFELRAGEVHALLGENGAGKSTLIRIVAGAHQPDSGSFTVAGAAVRHADPQRVRALGIAIIYQQPALFPDLSVAENIALGRESGSPWSRIDPRRRRDEARELLSRLGSAVDPDAPVSGLRMAEQQLVEIARALGASARILVMDEPTAALSEREAGTCSEWSATSARPAWGSCTSRTGSRRCWPSRIATRCSATAASWRRARAARSIEPG